MLLGIVLLRDNCDVLRKDATTGCMIVLLVVAWTADLTAQSSARIILPAAPNELRPNHNQIQEYSDGSIPDALGSRFDGSHSMSLSPLIKMVSSIVVMLSKETSD
jgi:hypothetical protein